MAVCLRPFFSSILPLPVLIYSVRDSDKPGTVLEGFQKVRSAEKLRPVLGRIAERLEQPGVDQRRNVVRLTVQNPARLLRRQAGGQLSQQRQKPKLIVFHTGEVAHPA